MKSKDLLLIGIAAFGVYYFMKNQNSQPGVTTTAGNDVILPPLGVAGINDVPHHLRYRHSHSGVRVRTHAVV